MPLEALDSAAYTTPLKLRGYTGQTTALSTLTHGDAAKILRRTRPDWTKSDHRTLADGHALAAQASEQEWSDLVDQAAVATFGRPFQVTDYRISGIACEEFPEEVKDRLRTLAHAKTHHCHLAGAHAWAAKWFRR